MQLDAAVESALNVLPSNSDASTSFSLYGLLNKAQTAMGKALLKVGGVRAGGQAGGPVICYVVLSLGMGIRDWVAGGKCPL